MKMLRGWKFSLIEVLMVVMMVGLLASFSSNLYAQQRTTSGVVQTSSGGDVSLSLCGVEFSKMSYNDRVGCYNQNKLDRERLSTQAWFCAYCAASAAGNGGKATVPTALQAIGVVFLASALSAGKPSMLYVGAIAFTGGGFWGSTVAENLADERNVALQRDLGVQPRTTSAARR